MAHVELVDLRSVLPHELERVEVDVGPNVGIGVDVHPTVDVRVPAAEVHLHGSVITRSTGRFPCRTSRPRAPCALPPIGRPRRQGGPKLPHCPRRSFSPTLARRCPIRPCARIRVRSGPVMPGGCRGRPRGRWPWRSRESGGRGSAAARRSGRPAASAPSTTGSARPERTRGSTGSRAGRIVVEEAVQGADATASTSPGATAIPAPVGDHFVGQRVARGRHHREAGPERVRARACGTSNAVST